MGATVGGWLLLALTGLLLWGYFALVFHEQAGRRHPVVALLWPVSLFWYSAPAIWRTLRR